MLPIRTVVLVAALVVAGCAAPAKQADDGAQEQKALGERIERVCALAEPDRTTEIEKLKSESGMVLYCGK